MPDSSRPSPPRILLTGATGFVGQAVLERLLRDPAAPTVYVLVRGADPQARLRKLFSNRVFDAWRTELGEAAAAREFTARVIATPGDLSLTATEPLRLPADLNTVIHAAATTDFDTTFEDALLTNVGGPHRLMSALTAAGQAPHLILVSTAYVGAERHRHADESLQQLDVHWADALTMAMAGHRHESDLNAKDHARDWARGHGFTDIYTVSKALAEQCAVDLWAEHPLTIVRPTIIESALAHPFPGWLDGFKVADPLIAAYGKGQLRVMPGRARGPLDVVPVDMVAALLTTVVGQIPPAGHPAILQLSSSTTNPVSLQTISTELFNFFRAQPWVNSSGPVTVPTPRWLTPSVMQAGMLAAGAVCRLRHRFGDRTARATEHNLRLHRRYVALYAPYTCSHTTFDDAGVRRLVASHPDGALFDVTRIDWQRYLTMVHFPTVVDQMRRARLARAQQVLDVRADATAELLLPQTHSTTGTP